MKNTIKKNRDKPKVGQTLYSLTLRQYTKKAKLTPVKVIKVGRKYFTCCPEGGSRWQEATYYIDSWAEKSDYMANSILYSSVQEYEDNKEMNKLCSDIEGFFRFGYNTRELSLDSLKKIMNIIKENE